MIQSKNSSKNPSKTRYFSLEYRIFMLHMSILLLALHATVANANHDVPGWLKNIPVNMKQRTMVLAISQGMKTGLSETSDVFLGPRKGLRGLRNAIRNQNIPQSLDGIVSFVPKGFPLDGNTWQKVVTNFRRKTDPNQRWAVDKFDQHNIGEMLGPEGSFLAAMMFDMDPRLAKLTPELAMSGLQGNMVADDKRGALNHKTHTGGIFQLKVGPDRVQSTSIRYLRGKLVKMSLSVDVVPFSQITNDKRDNWFLVEANTPNDKKHFLIGSIKPFEGAPRFQVPILLSPYYYKELAGNRLDLGSFTQLADKYKFKERLGETLLLQVLQSKWDQLKSATSHPTNRKVSPKARQALNQLLDECINTGKEITDSVTRDNLQILAREIGKGIFWATDAYPSTLILPAKSPQTTIKTDI